MVVAEILWLRAPKRKIRAVPGAGNASAVRRNAKRDAKDDEDETPKWAMNLMRKMDKVAGQVGEMNGKVDKAVDMATQAKNAAGQATQDVNSIKSEVVKLQGEVKALQGENFEKAVEKVIEKQDSSQKSATILLSRTQKEASLSSEWRPAKIEIKGFVSEEAWRSGKEELRDKESKSKQECIAFARQVVEALPEQVKTMIDLKPLDKYSPAYLYSRVDIPFASTITPSERQALLEAITQVLYKPEFALNGRSLRTSLELRPDLKINSRILGKAFGELRRLGATNSEMVAGYNPLCIKVLDGGRPVTVAVLEDGQWKAATKGREVLLPGKTDANVEGAQPALLTECTLSDKHFT